MNLVPRQPTALVLAATVLGGIALGFIAGWYGRALKPAHSAKQPRRTTPLSDEQFSQRFDRLDRAYTESIKEYDRLVTWISSGALAVSVTFVERLGAHARPDSAWMLATGWGLLSAALLSSLWSQYFSSRIHSWRQRELKHLQTQAADQSAEWADEARRLDLICRMWGKPTKYLTFASGVFLVGGFVALAFYAYVNLTTPTQTPVVAQHQDRPARVPNTRLPEIPEKRGLDDLIEPFPRPIVTPPPSTGGQEQK